jgi:hypothetical protein
LRDLTIEPEEPEPDGGQAVNGTEIESTMSRIHWESLLRALDSVQSLRLQGIEISSILPLLHTVVVLPHLQQLYIAQCDVRCAAQVPRDGIVLWNLRKFALPGGVVPGQAGLMARESEVGGGVGNELVALVQRRVGLEVVLVRCGVDEEVLDELRKHAQVSLGDESEWVYV